jgi:pimeloyl-ACP methyl ester carboxylesterase
VVVDRAVPAPDGTRLAVSIHGAGPTLLMIPGLGSSRAIYDPLVSVLAGSCRIAVYDPRGIGESEATPGPYTMAQLAADAAAVIAAIADSAVAVWGASMGGMVAQHLALDHPERVAQLLLACTGPGGVHAVRADPEATRALLGKGARTPGEAYAMACTVMYTSRFQAEHAAFVAAQVAHRAANPVRPAVFRAQYDAVRAHDTFDRLPAISAPTLVLHGTEDLVMPVGNGQVLAERIPGAALRLFPEQGHLFFHEAPGEAASAVRDFLRLPATAG